MEGSQALERNDVTVILCTLLSSGLGWTGRVGRGTIRTRRESVC